MKKMKKLASLVLALAMALTLAVPALAAEEKGSITISDAVVGQTYTVYQILDLESYNAAAKAYSYKATSDWSSFINSDAIKGVYVEVDPQGYVTWKDGADAAAFAKLAQAYAKKNNTTASADAVTASSSTVKFEELYLGYYLVDTTLGTLCSLDTTNPDAIMEEKNEVPDIKKEVQEASDGSWGEKNDADINQTVNFKATITAYPGAENYIMHDSMSAGLTFKPDSVVIAGLTEGTDYTVETTDLNCTDLGEKDPCNFHIVFTKTYLDKIADKGGKTIVVTYSATLNENAVVAGMGNPNTVKLEYNDKFTPEDITRTYTWKMDVEKYTEKDGGSVKLAGATFKLSTDEAGVNVIKFHALGDDKYQVCANATCTKGHVTEITTDTDGKLFIEGLDAGTYYLTETAAPAGYNKLTDPIVVEITAAKSATEASPAGTVSYTVDNKTKTGTVGVLNQTGTELPSTGGMGTTLFYALGAVLVIGAGVAMVTKKRMG